MDLMPSIFSLWGLQKNPLWAITLPFLLQPIARHILLTPSLAAPICVADEASRGLHLQSQACSLLVPNGRGCDKRG